MIKEDNFIHDDNINAGVPLRLNLKQNGFTAEEQNVMDLICEANERFNSMLYTHVTESEDWNKAIHQLQFLLGMRILRRDYPDQFTHIK